MNGLIQFFPPPRIQLDGYLWPKSHCKCGSDGRFLKRKKCLNPNCMNYEDGFPSKDYNPRYAYVDLEGCMHYNEYKPKK